MTEEHVRKKKGGYEPFDAELYFDPKTNFWRFLRTFNILEPGRPVISISKMYMWLSFVMVAVVFAGTLYAVATVDTYTWEMLASVLVLVIGASVNMFNATGNYRHRRESVYLQTRGYSENFDAVDPSIMDSYNRFGGGRRFGGGGFGNPMSGYTAPPPPDVGGSGGGDVPQTEREAEEAEASRYVGE